MLTREYVARGDNPLGPVCPGAGLLASIGVGTGETVACDFIGSGSAEPIAADCFLITVSHGPCACSYSGQLTS